MRSVPPCTLVLAAFAHNHDAEAVCCELLFSHEKTACFSERTASDRSVRLRMHPQTAFDLRARISNLLGCAHVPAARQPS
eukprot:1905134-Pleurochrysis_carterae.AAC.1